MKIAYLILAENFGQTARVVKRLSADNTSFITYENIRWETISVIKAMLAGLQQLLDDAQKPDYAIVLSGYCYPIASPKKICNFISTHENKILMHHHPLRDEEKERIDRYHFSSGRVFPPQRWPTSLKGKLFNKFLSLRYPLPRKFPSYVTPFSGSPFWGLPRYAVEHVFTFLKEHPDYLMFHEHTRIPEEMFFQTIFFNAHDDIKNRIVRNDLHYVDWFKPNVPLPAVLGVEDLDKMMNSKKLFARKIVDHNVMDLIDQRVDANE